MGLFFVLLDCPVFHQESSIVNEQNDMFTCEKLPLGLR
ncbi:MAG: hypothetical protein K0R47_3427 [Brevibacillus sp.]|nr:hypothetical protein [Brevibacillus sp.]